MKFEKMNLAEVRPNDAPSMCEAITALLEDGYDVRRPKDNLYQLKVSETLSYYPSTGRIFEDGAAGAMEERGLDAFLNLLASRKPLRLR